MKQIAMVAVLIAATGIAGVAVSGDRGAREMNETVTVYSVEQGRLVTLPKVVKSDDEWRRELSQEAYEVTRRKGTERSCSGAFWKNEREGLYRCVACGNDLFVSSSKFSSATGWPSFFQPVDEANIGTETDRSYGMVRTEVHCARCGAHLGHVFDDGPKPTGKRYCINSAALEFVPMDVSGVTGK